MSPLLNLTREGNRIPSQRSSLSLSLAVLRADPLSDVQKFMLDMMKSAAERKLRPLAGMRENSRMCRQAMQLLRYCQVRYHLTLKPTHPEVSSLDVMSSWLSQCGDSTPQVT